ncbi:MAG: pyruvate kinase [Acidobacteria bacterium]|nr:pyruvate kinase [Acidobacteriota bacterium]
MRHTKIIATVGPASSAPETLDDLIGAGVDIFRLNFSHGTRTTHEATFRRIRDAANRAERTVAIMQDLSGPKIRIGTLVDGRPLALKPRDSLRIGTGEFVGVPGRVSTTYAELARSVRPGDRLLLDDGRIELQVEETDGTEIVTRVVEGGELAEHKGISAPGVTLPASALTTKDVDDLKWGIVLGVDMVAVSFVRSAADLARVHDIAAAAGTATLPLVAKIERPDAVANIDDILGACDAVMVARGDLGLEMPLERVPRIQKEITRRARARGIPVIVATQVLESMRTEPRPTRAEVSDAANAVDDGVDAIMLAGETAIGVFPARSVQVLDVIIREAESMLPPASATMLPVEGEAHGRALCEAAVTLATSGHADAIVAVTRGGRTARSLSALRPRAPIYAATADQSTANALTLYWGVTPVVSEIPDDVESAGALMEQQLLARGALPPGAVVVLVSISPDLSRPGANFLKVHRLGAST